MALLLIWVMSALWAANYIVARKAPGVVEPYTLALGRWALAGVLLAFMARAELWREKRAVAAVWYQYVVLGFLGMLVCGASVYLGVRTTVAMNIALIYSASPVLIALGAVLWLGERFVLRQVLGLLVAMAGVTHVIVKGQWMALADFQWVAGDGWILAAMAAWGVLNEPLGWHHLVGGALIMPGVFLMARSARLPSRNLASAAPSLR